MLDDVRNLSTELFHEERGRLDPKGQSNDAQKKKKARDASWFAKGILVEPLPDEDLTFAREIQKPRIASLSSSSSFFLQRRERKPTVRKNSIT